MASENANSTVPRLPRWAWWALGTALVVIAVLALWAFSDFLSYQAELRRASNGVATTAKELREIDIQEHIAGFNYGILLFAAFGFILTCVTLVFLAATLNESRKMTSETRRMVNEQRDAAKEVNDASKAAQALSRTESRAYLRAFEARLVPEGSGWDVKISYRNDGATPALHIWHRVLVAVRSEPWRGAAPIVFDDDVVKSPYTSKRPVPPHTEDTFRYSIPNFDNAEAQSQAAAGTVVTFIGTVFYRDTFGEVFCTDFEFFLQKSVGDSLRASRKNLQAALLRQDAVDEIAKLRQEIKGVALKWGKRGAGGVYRPYTGEPPFKVDTASLEFRSF